MYLVVDEGLRAVTLQKEFLQVAQNHALARESECLCWQDPPELHWRAYDATRKA